MAEPAGTASGEAADRARPGRRAPWWDSAVPWFCLLCLALLPGLPRRNVLVDLAGALGAVWLVWSVRRYGPLLSSRTLRWGVGLFLASAVLSTLYPLCLDWQGPAAAEESAHALWQTLRGVVAAGLALRLLGSRRGMRSFLALLLLPAVLLPLWAPLDFWLRGEVPLWLQSRLRLTGTGALAHRFAVSVYLYSIPAWVMLLSPAYRRAALPRWVRGAGYALGPAVALLLLRKTLPGSGESWLPVGSEPARELSFYLLAALMAGAGVLAWRGILHPGRPRATVCGIALGLAFVNLGLASVRLQALLAVLFGAGMVVVLARRKLVPLALLGAGTVAAFGVLLLHPVALNPTSLQQRLWIWQQTVPLVREHWLLGVGYGSDAFQAGWQRYRHLSPPEPNPRFPHLRPYPQAYHAHNLWLELWAERGVVGLAAFHLLWFAALGRLALALRRLPPGRPGRPPVCAGLLLLLLLAVDGVLNWPLGAAAETLHLLVAGAGLAGARMGSGEA